MRTESTSGPAMEKPNMDKPRRKNPFLWGGAMAVLFLVAAIWLGLSALREREARDTLDQLLAENPEVVQPVAPPVGPPVQDPGDPSGARGGWFDFPLFSAAGDAVNVQESPDRYVLRVPLAQGQDADSVRLSVMPHRIEVSGQSASGRDGATVSTSFMQSFSTSDEVLPNAIQRRIEKRDGRTTLVITIPKKHAGSSAPRPSVPLHRDDVQNAPEPEIPLDGVEPKVI